MPPDLLSGVLAELVDSDPTGQLSHGPAGTSQHVIGWTHLHQTLKRELIRVLLDLGADLVAVVNRTGLP